MRQLIRPFLLCPVVAALLLLACSSPQERRELQRLLAEADSMNRNYVDFTTDSVLLRAVRLADRHGSNRDRVRARYLLGCAYRDMGEAPQALDCYHQAIDLADTTSTDSAYLVQIAKIHGQAGDLFYQQRLARSAIQEYLEGERLAWRARDTMSALLIYGAVGDCYHYLLKDDSMLIASERTRRLLLEYGDTMMANTFLSQPIAYLLSRERYDEVKPLLYTYEYNSAVADTARSEPNYAYLNYYKGEYARGMGQRDSARIYFYRFLDKANSPDARMLAYYGLLRLYRSSDETDSLKRYVDKYLSVADTIDNYTEQSRLQEIQGLYNYSRHQQLLGMLQKKSLELKSHILGLSLLLAMMVFCAVLYTAYQRRRNRRRLHEMAASYSYAIAEYWRLRWLLSSAEAQRDIAEASYLKLRERYTLISDALANVQSDNKPPEEWDIEDALLDSTVVRKLHHLSASRTMPEDCWFELYSLVDAHMPNFVAFLKEKGLKQESKEFKVCVLLRLRFSLSEINISLGISSQSLTNIRSRLQNRLFGIKGGAKDFDEHILSVPR